MLFVSMLSLLESFLGPCLEIPEGSDFDVYFGVGLLTVSAFGRAQRLMPAPVAGPDLFGADSLIVFITQAHPSKSFALSYRAMRCTATDNDQSAIASP